MVLVQTHFLFIYSPIMLNTCVKKISFMVAEIWSWIGFISASTNRFFFSDSNYWSSWEIAGFLWCLQERSYLKLWGSHEGGPILLWCIQKPESKMGSEDLRRILKPVGADGLFFFLFSYFRCRENAKTSMSVFISCRISHCLSSQPLSPIPHISCSEEKVMGDA